MSFLEWFMRFFFFLTAVLAVVELMLFPGTYLFLPFCIVALTSLGIVVFCKRRVLTGSGLSKKLRRKAKRKRSRTEREIARLERMWRMPSPARDEGSNPFRK